MNKKLKISLSSLSKETQRRVKRELSQLKQSKRVLSNTPLSEEAKAWLDKVVKGTWTQRPDGKIDVNGTVYATFNRVIQNFLGKEIFFGDVTGSFYCDNTNITSLKGSPEKVGGSFYCFGTKITSLEGAPEVVVGSFYCFGTKITSLEGAPEVVGGSFYCDNTNITSLEGIGKVGGVMYFTDTLYSEQKKKEVSQLKTSKRVVISEKKSEVGLALMTKNLKNLLAPMVEKKLVAKNATDPYDSEESYEEADESITSKYDSEDEWLDAHKIDVEITKVYDVQIKGNKVHAKVKLGFYCNPDINDFYLSDWAEDFVKELNKSKDISEQLIDGATYFITFESNL